MATETLCQLENSLSIEFIPILFIVVFALTVILTITVALCKRQVKTIPILCNAGSWVPSYYILGSGLSMSATLMSIMIILMHVRIIRATVAADGSSMIISSSSCTIVSYVAVVIGIISTISLAALGIINFHDFPALHNAAATTYIFTGVLYQLMHSILSLSVYTSVANHNVLYARLVIAIICAVSTLAMVFPGYLESKRSSANQRIQRSLSIHRPEGYRPRHSLGRDNPNMDIVLTDLGSPSSSTSTITTNETESPVKNIESPSSAGITDLISAITTCGAQTGISSDTAEGFPEWQPVSMGFQRYMISEAATTWVLCGCLHIDSKWHMKLWAILQYISLLMSVIYYGTYIYDFQQICVVL